jgi:hypothetical protein
MIQTKLLRGALLAILAAAGAAAAKAKELRQPSLYIPQASLEALQFPPAPAPDSGVDKADLALLHDWQDRRTKQQCATAQAQADDTYDEFFGDVSPLVKPLPQEPADFLLQLKNDVEVSVALIKSRNQPKSGS